MAILRRVTATAPVLVGVAMTAAVAFGAQEESPPPKVETSPRGHLVNSRNGGAILHAEGLSPGHSTGGRVTISNQGAAPQELRLSQTVLAEDTGTGGGRLSRRLHLTVELVSRRATPVRVYSGRLSGLRSVRLAPLAPGASRTYRLRVHFRDGGTPRSSTGDDNAYQSAAISMRYDWVAGCC